MFLNNRDHRKITVIDGKVGYTGGYNLANEYFNYDTSIRENGRIRESSGRRCGGFAYGDIFLEMWKAVSDKDVDVLDIEAQKKYLVQHPYQAKQTGYIQPYADCPLETESRLERMSISVSSIKRTDTAGS